jgi:hypothetical protein
MSTMMTNDLMEISSGVNVAIVEILRQAKVLVKG